MEPMGKPIQQNLDATRAWWRATRLFGGVAWTLAVLVVLALLCFHADRLLTLSASARETWRVLIALGGLSVLGLAFLLTLMRRLPDADLAADVERRYPVLRERLLTAVDLAPGLATASGDPGSLSSGFSRSMTQALVDETQRDTAGLDFRRAVNLRPVRTALLTALFTIGLLALHFALAPDAFANWVKRMADPRADIAPWANTRVYVQPQAEVLPRGAGVDVVVTTRGTTSDHAVLHFRNAGEPNAPWQTLELNHPTTVRENATGAGSSSNTRLASLPGESHRSDTVPPQQFRYHFPSLAQSVAMYATANDGRSNEKDVAVEDRPTLLGMKMTMRYPAYTRKPAQTMTVSSGNIAAPFGTEVEIVAGANKPLKSAGFVLNNVPAGEWAVNKDKATGHVSVRKDSVYALNLVDKHGFDNPAAPKYEIRAIKDQTPAVQITRPTADIDLQPEGSLPLVARAVDDYGVNNMKLVYSAQHDAAMNGKSAGTPGSLSLPGPTGTPTADVAERWHIASVHPRVGDLLSFYVTATDNDTLTGPHTGRSTAYRVHVVSLAEMQKRLAEQMTNEQKALAELRKQQIEAQKQLRQAQQKPDAANLSRAQEAQRAIAQEAKAVAQRIADTSAQLENNNLATKSELDRRNEAEKMVNDIAQQKAPAAADNVQKAQEPKKGDTPRSASLAKADNQEAEIKRDIEKAQDKLSRAPSPEQLASELKNLAKNQQDRADASRTLAEDIAAQKKQNGGQMSPEDKTGLEMERKQQADLNADTKRVQDQLNQAAKSAAERGQDKQAKALRDAAKALQQGSAEQHQQAAQSNLQKDSPAKAAPEQDRAAAALAKAAESAKEAADPTVGENSKQTADRLDKAAEQLRDLAKQQKDLANQAEQNPGQQQSQNLANQQKSLQNQTAQAQKALNGAPQAQKSAQNAQQNQSKSGQQLSQNQPKSAQQPAKTAAQQLEEAAKQAEQAANQLRQQQAAQEMADKVEHLAQVQRGVQNATQRLNTAQQRGPLSNNDEHELGQTAERQHSVEEQAKTLAEQFPSPAFKKALQMASKQMHPATQNLNQARPNTGDQTQAAQNRAAQTLETIAQALKQQAQAGQQGEQQQGEQQQGGSPEQKQQAADLGDLKLAQGLQQQARQETGKLDKERAKNPGQQLNPGQQQQAQELANTQQQAKEIAEQAGQDLSSLPGVGEAIQKALPHMDQAGNKLSQQQTGQPTQGHQDEALKGLDQAMKSAQEAMQQQQQQQASSQGQQPGMPQPGPKQKGNNPDKNAFTRLEDPQKGETHAPENRMGKGFGNLNPRAQRTLREGQKEPVPAEYQDVVSRYYKSLAEKKGK